MSSVDFSAFIDFCFFMKSMRKYSLPNKAFEKHLAFTMLVTIYFSNGSLTLSQTVSFDFYKFNFIGVDNCNGLFLTVAYFSLSFSLNLLIELSFHDVFIMINELPIVNVRLLFSEKFVKSLKRFSLRDVALAVSKSILKSKITRIPEWFTIEISLPNVVAFNPFEFVSKLS